MKCNKKMLFEYIDDNLKDKERKEVEQHLEQCNVCREVYNAFLDMEELSTCDYTMQTDLTESIMDKIEDLSRYDAKRIAFFNKLFSPKHKIHRHVLTCTISIIVCGFLLSNGELITNFSKIQAASFDKIKSFILTPKVKTSIVIYNTDEDVSYDNGTKIQDISQVLKDSLSKYGLDCIYLKDNKETSKELQFKQSYDLVVNNIKDYNEDVILDIHLDVPRAKTKDNGISILICTGNPNYEKNKAFADKLINEFKGISQLPIDLITIREGENFFNQNLSEKALLIYVGTLKSTDKDLNESVKALGISLKNIVLNSK